MGRQRINDAGPAIVRADLEGVEPPLPFNVSRLDTLLQGKTRLRGAIECGVTIAIMLLLVVAITVLRLRWGLAGLTGTPT